MFFVVLELFVVLCPALWGPVEYLFFIPKRVKIKVFDRSLWAGQWIIYFNLFVYLKISDFSLIGVCGTSIIKLVNYCSL